MPSQVSAVDRFAERLTFYTASYLAGFVFLLGLVQLPARRGMFGQHSVFGELLSLCGIAALAFCAVWAGGSVAWWTLKRKLQNTAK